MIHYIPSNRNFYTNGKQSTQWKESIIRAAARNLNGTRIRLTGEKWGQDNKQTIATAKE